MTAASGNQKLKIGRAFFLLAAVAPLLASAGEPAESHSWETLKGEFTVSGAPGDIENKPVGTHFQIRLTGTAAEKLWNVLQTGIITNPCNPQKGTVKALGEIWCQHADEDYSCTFLIDGMDGGLSRMPC